MKFASLKSNQNPDGELVVVSRDLSRACRVANIAASLREAVEHWETCSAKLQTVYDGLNAGTVESFNLDPTQCHSPLPRAFGFLDGSAYIQHIKLVRKARNAELPETLLTVPLMYQALSDGFLAPHEDIPMVHFDHGVDFEGEVGVITGPVPMGTKAKDAAPYVRLLVLINDVSLRGLIPGELAQGFGFMQSKPASSFAPIAITPDELGDAWREGRVHLPLNVTFNGHFFGNADAGHMHFSFYELIQHAARTRNLAAGHIIGSGTVSNEDESRGCSCLAEIRMLEKINSGTIKTPFMKPGDRVRIEMLKDQQS
ncbi:MAG: fumarylacetoacetate hydrolase family protein, partial [Acidobacteria bacterium]|nr:fumarylacetoacetate hydrolase family protein [Acidobacteriota bacterium]